MENVKLETECPHCANKLRLNFNSWTHQLELEKPDVTPYKDKMNVVEHYKKVKGYDRFKGWDQAHRARAFGYAKTLLASVSDSASPCAAAKEAIDWTRDAALRKGLDWNLGTVVKWAPDYLKDAETRKILISKPKCVGCGKTAIEGASVCQECSWCWKCDDAGRDCQKAPTDMVPQVGMPPICKACAGAKA